MSSRWRISSSAADQDLGVGRLQPQLPEQVLLQRLGPLQRALQETLLRVRVAVAVQALESGIGGVAEQLLFRAILDFVERIGRIVGHDLQRRIAFQLLVDGELQVGKRQRHDLDRLIELRRHPQALFLPEAPAAALAW